MKAMADIRKYCCSECFLHPWLKTTVKEGAVQPGSCFYCGSQGLLAPIALLSAGFDTLLSDYILAEAANGGGDSDFPSESPVRAIQRDWRLFGEPFMERFPDDFLAVALEDTDNVRRLRDLTMPVVAFHRNAMSTAFANWLGFFSLEEDEFGQWAERHFALDLLLPGTFISKAKDHLEHLSRTMPVGGVLWRARAEYVGSFFGRGIRPLPLDQMGSNPTHPASRLNRDGEQILYCAETEKTAIAEIRPGRGFFCTTCELALTKEIRVIDLAAPAEEINPFTSSDLSWRLDLQRIARNLNGLIAKPISRGEDKELYQRTQFFSFIVRAMGVHGIRFPSSLDFPYGVNLGLFSSDIVTFRSSRLVYITTTEVAYEGR
jgi:hypothetical protein